MKAFADSVAKLVAVCLAPSIRAALFLSDRIGSDREDIFASSPVAAPTTASDYFARQRLLCGENLGKWPSQRTPRVAKTTLVRSASGQPAVNQPAVATTDLFA